ncbi:MAG: LysM peptidoglycan-binding domain-containing protein, partial [Acutalibacteraceae bacterium]|nr:LysM peptidoglycan-binding domain-containing protein [Acutalibacteraceae bacterium]
ISETYHCKKTVQREENISSGIDLWCNVQNVTTKFEECNIIICGTVMAGMIICNENGNAIYCEKPVDFEYKYPLDCKLGAPHSEPQIEILSCGYTITSADCIELRIDISINASVYEKCDMSLISDMTVDENETVARKTKGAMTIYFPSNNECVWDIARIYNASVEEIMRINELESENLDGGKMILVPVM